MLRRRAKYSNKIVRIDGHTFDSVQEAERYGELKLLVLAREIEALAVHPTYALNVNGQYVGSVEFDFSYRQAGNYVIEDVKGKDWKTGRRVTETELSRFKRRVFEALYERAVTVVERTGKRDRPSRARSEKEWKKDAKDS